MTTTKPFSEILHPRGADGQFIKKFGLINVADALTQYDQKRFGFGALQGQVTEITEGERGNPIINFQVTDPRANKFGFPYKLGQELKTTPVFVTKRDAPKAKLYGGYATEADQAIAMERAAINAETGTRPRPLFGPMSRVPEEQDWEGDWNREAGDYAEVAPMHQDPPEGYYNEDPTGESPYIEPEIMPANYGHQVIWAKSPYGGALGYLKYKMDADGKARIDVVRTNPAFQRQGVATWLTEALFALEHIDHNDVVADFTPAGADFWNARFSTDVQPNTEMREVRVERPPTAQRREPSVSMLRERIEADQLSSLSNAYGNLAAYNPRIYTAAWSVLLDNAAEDLKLSDPNDQIEFRNRVGDIAHVPTVPNLVAYAEAEWGIGSETAEESDRPVIADMIVDEYLHSIGVERVQPDGPPRATPPLRDRNGAGIWLGDIVSFERNGETLVGEIVGTKGHNLEVSVEPSPGESDIWSVSPGEALRESEPRAADDGDWVATTMRRAEDAIARGGTPKQVAPPKPGIPPPWDYEKPEWPKDREAKRKKMAEDGVDWTDDITDKELEAIRLGLSMKTDRFSVATVVRDSADGTLRTESRIFDSEDKYIGELERVIRPGSSSVYNALFRINPSVRGQGIGTEIFQHFEDYWTTHGIEYMEVSANIDVGGYAWARAGYDWTNSDGIITESTYSRVRGLLDQINEAAISFRYMPGNQGNPEAETHFIDVQREVQRILTAMLNIRRDQDGVIGLGDIPTPFELSELGRRPGDENWPGKKGLLGSSWGGRKDLKKPKVAAAAHSSADIAAIHDQWVLDWADDIPLRPDQQESPDASAWHVDAGATAEALADFDARLAGSVTTPEGVQGMLYDTKPLLAAVDFDPNLHPRGRDGEFIETFGIVELLGYITHLRLDGTATTRSFTGERGEVTHIIPDPDQPDNPMVRVELPDGSVAFARPSQVIGGPEEKGRLEQPGGISPSPFEQWTPDKQRRSLVSHQRVRGDHLTPDEERIFDLRLGIVAEREGISIDELRAEIVDDAAAFNRDEPKLERMARLGERERVKQRALLNQEIAALDPADADKRFDQLEDLYRKEGETHRFPDVGTDATHDRLGPKQDEYTPERRAQHEAMWDDVLAQVEQLNIPKEGDVLALGGLSGAGKTTSLEPGKPAAEYGVKAWETDRNPEAGITYTHVSINPDSVKLMMIDRGMLPEEVSPGMKPLEQVTFIHEESSTLSKEFMVRFGDLGYNMVLDNTMDSDRGMDKRITPLAHDGYKFRGLFIDITPEESQTSVMNRYLRQAFTTLGGRFVPSWISDPKKKKSRRGRFSTNRDNFDKLVEDGWFTYHSVIDNTGVSKDPPAPKGDVTTRGTGTGAAAAEKYKEKWGVYPGWWLTMQGQQEATSPSQFIPPPNPTATAPTTAAGDPSLKTIHMISSMLRTGKLTPEQALEEFRNDQVEVEAMEAPPIASDWAAMEDWERPTTVCGISFPN